MNNCSSASSPTVNRQEIHRVLQLKRKQREAKACYPCRQRKVKCDNGHPCRTCRKRGHPQICVYDVGGPSHAEQRNGLDDNNSRSVGSRQGSSLLETGDAGVTGLRARSEDDDDDDGTSNEFVAGQDNATTTVTSSSSSRRRRRTTRGTSRRCQQQHERVSSGGASYPEETSAATEEGSKDYTIFSGDNSVVSILRLRTQDRNGSMAREAGSILGLQNTGGSYPFMDLKTKQDRWIALLEVLPQRHEVLKFFHFYRVTAYPFNPILVDIDHFESDLCTYLTGHAAGELRDPKRISEHWSTDKSLGYISLLLATLAAGAHFSDVENPKRSELCLDFVRRSFQTLRLANFLFRSSLDSIQALLILGNTLQNTGQSDAAWVMLGTTVRLAQTLGLHTERSVSHWPDYVKSKAKSLWSTIVWQDSLLSLCYDRPHIVSVSGWTPDMQFASRQNLSYTDVMHYICRLTLEFREKLAVIPEDNDLRGAIDALTSLDDVYGRTQPHLQKRENCKTLQQHLEHLALRMHVSFAVSVFCRPAIQKTPQPLTMAGPRETLLRARAKESLINASKAFLDFQALSVVPLRTWSMVHTALSSTLLLCLWEETRNDLECCDLQHRVIEVFSAAESGEGGGGSREDVRLGTPSDNNNNNNNNNAQWLSERHIRALVTLRNAVSGAPLSANNNNNQSDNNNNNPPFSHSVQDAAQRSNEANSNHDAATTGTAGFRQDNNPFLYPRPFVYGREDVSFTDALNLNDLSPITYLDFIMNVPSLDFTHESGFSLG